MNGIKKMRINKVFEINDFSDQSPIIDECLEIFNILPYEAKCEFLKTFPFRNKFYRLLNDTTTNTPKKKGWLNTKEFQNNFDKTLAMIDKNGMPYQIQNGHPYLKLWEIAWTIKFSGLDKNSIVLNAGSGLSFFPDIFLSKKCKKLFSIDNYTYQESNIEIRKNCYRAYDPNHMINFSERNILNTGFEDNFFDIIISHSVVEHIPDRIAVFKELSRIVKPGGIIATASVHSFTEQLYAMPSCYISSSIDDMLKLLPNLKLYGEKYFSETSWHKNILEKDKVDCPYPYVCNVFFLKKIIY